MFHFGTPNPNWNSGLVAVFRIGTGGGLAIQRGNFDCDRVYPVKSLIRRTGVIF